MNDHDANIVGRTNAPGVILGQDVMVDDTRSLHCCEKCWSTVKVVGRRSIVFKKVVERLRGFLQFSNTLETAKDVLERRSAHQVPLSRDAVARKQLNLIENLFEPLSRVIFQLASHDLTPRYTSSAPDSSHVRASVSS